MSGVLATLVSLPLVVLSDLLSSGVCDFCAHSGVTWLRDYAAGMISLMSVVGVFSLKRIWQRHDELKQGVSGESRPSSAGDQQLSSCRREDNDPIAWNSLACGHAAINVVDGLQDRLTEALSGTDDNESRWLFNSMPDGVCVTDLQGLVSRTNPSFLSILDIEHATDELIAELIAELSTETAADIRSRLHRGATSFVLEIRAGKIPDRIILRLSCSPLLDDECEQRGLVWCLRDVTQQKLADEMRNEFVFTAAHELRTPLAHLQAYAETLALEEGIDVERQKQFCNIINSEATRLARFVNELLDVSQMEGGELAITRHPVDIERLVEEVVEHVQPDITRRAQVFDYQPPAKMPKLTGDKDKLSAALVNLLGNASKYTPEGGRLGLQITLDERQIQFHVEDTGHGICEEEQSLIYDKFFRSKDERVLAESGNGLGLSYTQQVARLHGGRVTVKSELDRGSRFTLTLPQKQAVTS